jgi:hypothetical protein
MKRLRSMHHIPLLELNSSGPYTRAVWKVRSLVEDIWCGWGPMLPVCCNIIL